MLAYSTVSGPFPFESATTNTTINFGISNHRDFDGTSIHQPTQTDWGVGIVGLPNDLNHRKATSWDTQTVCLQYFTGTGATMSSCMVPGSPYMTFTFNNAAVTIQSLNGNLGNITWVNAGEVHYKFARKVSSPQRLTHYIYCSRNQGQNYQQCRHLSPLCSE